MNRTPTIEHFKRAAARVRPHRLSNGLQILLYPEHSVPVVTSMIWYRVGTLFEEVGATGISHFLEHMMFKGSRSYAKGEIDYITTLNGGANNAFTSKDYTTYYFSFASDRWVPALEIEADRMEHLLFEPLEFQLERGVILEELRMERDDPWNTLRERVEEAALGEHPYRFPIIGRSRDIENLALDALRAHYKRYYVPANSVLVAAGDLEVDQTLERITELFASIPAGDAAHKEPTVSRPRTSPERVEVPSQGRVDRLLLAFPAPSLSDDDHYAFHLLDRVLVEGRLSRLHSRLVERTPMVSFVSGDFADTAEPYLYFLRLEVLPGSHSEMVEQVLFEELDRLLDEGISEAELERAKNQCLVGTIASFETTFDLAAQLGLSQLLHRPGYWESYLDRIEAASLEQIQQVASHYLDHSKVVIGVSPSAH